MSQNSPMSFVLSYESIVNTCKRCLPAYSNWQQTLTRLPLATQIADINVASGGSTDHEHQHGVWKEHGSQTSALAAVWITDITVVSGSSMNYGSLMRRLNPESEPFFISDILLLRFRMIVKLSSVTQDRTCKSYLLLCSILVGASLQVPWASLCCLPLAGSLKALCSPPLTGQAL